MELKNDCQVDCIKEAFDNLIKADEFQNKKIEELEAENARLKAAVNIQEYTIKRLKLLLGKEHKETEDLVVKTGYDEQETEKAYQRGINDAWDAVNKILKLNTNARTEIFSCATFRNTIDMFSAFEAIKRLKAYEQKQKDLTDDHKFKFGDKVFVPWSDEPYMYIKPGELYNPRTKSCAYVGKTQHLKRFGEKFEIK